MRGISATGSRDKRNTTLIGEYVRSIRSIIASVRFGAGPKVTVSPLAGSGPKCWLNPAPTEE